MNKKVFGRKLSRERDTRRALLRSLAGGLITYGKIETTRAKAKFVQPFMENVVKIAKKGTVAGRRKLLADFANDIETVNLLFKTISNINRESGLTRIIPLPQRRGDQAAMARLEWSDLSKMSKKDISDKSKKESVKETKKSKEVKKKEVGKLKK